MNSSKLSAFCDRVLEAGWLLGVTITPVFFNVYSSRVFEPDKLTTMRALATVMAVFWLVRFLEEAIQRQKPLRFSWRTPLVLPALVTMGVYLITSIFSLVPYTSFVGSYQRLQGTYSLFGYLVIFFALLTSLRTRAQLSRLITVLILNSLPVALYGIVQHNGLDPLPWAGNVQTRVASNMGNAIFVAAYLIMIVPLTAARIVESFKDIMRREKSRTSDVLRASGYIFLMAVQLMTIWYSRSRGPWLGIIAGGFLFPYLMFILLQQQAAAQETESSPWYRDVGRGLGFGVGTLVLAGLLAGLGILAIPGKYGAYIGGGLGALTFGGIWLYFVVERKGWRWLWIGWGTVGLGAILALLAINVPGPLNERAMETTSLRRMAQSLDWESKTGKVRTLIWQGAVELFMPHDPLTYPDGSHDKFNALRPLVGYGPESMYVAYNGFYPPELGHVESRTASPDRSHNETLDSLVITGLLGFAAYLFLYGSVFYWGFRWLGLLNTRRQFWIYVGLSFAIFLALFILFVSLERPYFFAVAVPLGFLAGTVFYLTWFAFQTTRKGVSVTGAMGKIHPHAVLLVAILAAILAHFVEINFAISIAATHTTFWALAGMLVVLGLQWLPGEAEAQPARVAEKRPAEGMPKSKAARRRKKRRAKPAQSPVVRKPSQGWVMAVLALSLAATFLLGTLAFDFINNPDRSTNAGQIFWHSLTVLHAQNKTSFGGLMIFVFTWVLFGVIGLSELDREGLFGKERGERWVWAILLYSSVTLLGLLIFGSVLASLQAQLPQIEVHTAEDVIGVAVTLAGVLGRYYAFIFVILALTAWVLLHESAQAQRWGDPVSFIVLSVLLLLCVPLIRAYDYNLIRADIVFKQGGGFANSRDLNQKQLGLQHYEKAIEYAPLEDYYRLFQGKTYLEIAQTLPADIDPAQREGIFLKTEQVLLEARELNPLNTDHSANLARFYRGWAAQVQDPQQSEQLLRQAEENYHTALILSPHNPILWNELAVLEAFDLHDEIVAQEVISHSLAVDPEFEQTWSLLGDMRVNIDKDVPGAIAAYERSLEIASKQCTVRRVLGSLQIQESRWDDAAAQLEQTLEYCPTMGDLWDIYRMLGISYFYQGRPAEALQMANMALQLAPEEQRPVIEQLITAIQQPPSQP